MNGFRKCGMFSDYQQIGKVEKTGGALPSQAALPLSRGERARVRGFPGQQHCPGGLFDLLILIID